MTMPTDWRSDAFVQMAIREYLDHKTIKTAISPARLETLIDYFNHYVFASLWVMNPEAYNLRLQADKMETVEDVDKFIGDCLKLGIDPL
jgi:hypothetical protein